MTERPHADGVSASDQERSTVGDLVARVTASGDLGDDGRRAGASGPATSAA